MIMQVLHCPHCQGTDIIRHGKTRQGKQRYCCQETGGCFTCVGPSQMARPNSYRLMNSPITRSCIYSVLEKQMVRRTSRLIRVRRLMCLLSIFCVFSLPTRCCSVSICRSYAPHPSV